MSSDDNKNNIRFDCLRGPLFSLLDANGIRHFGLKALLTSPSLGKLRDLDLYGNQVGDLGVQILARSPRLGQLVRLNLRNNRIGDDGVKDLAASPYLGALRAIDLSHNDITAVGMAALRKSVLGNPRVKLVLDAVDEAPAVLDIVA